MSASDSNWTPARARAMDVIAGPDGIIVGAAMDHRDAFRLELAKRSIEATDRYATAMKVAIARRLAPHASVVLLDVESSAAQAVVDGAVPGDTALVIALEAQGYGEATSDTATTFLEHWSPARTAAFGGAGCKLLLPYRVDRPAHAEAQERVVLEALTGCREVGVALIVEPIVHRTDRDDDNRFAELVVEGARRLATFYPDVLKVQYPGSAQACRALDEACGPRVPWVLLGGGAPGAAIVTQIRQACAAGASGFIVGRTLFATALSQDPGASERALRDVSVPLLQELAAVAREHAVPWRSRIGPIEQPRRDWYR